MGVECIYCREVDRPSSTKEHVLPEFMGNRHWVLSRGVVCDACQRRMSKVESKVASSIVGDLVRMSSARGKGGFKSINVRAMRWSIPGQEKLEASDVKLTILPSETPQWYEPPEFDDSDEVATGQMEVDINHQRRHVGAMLSKILLGMVASLMGTDAALDPALDIHRVHLDVRTPALPIEYDLELNAVPNRLWKAELAVKRGLSVNVCRKVQLGIGWHGKEPHNERPDVRTLLLAGDVNLGHPDG